MSILLTTFLDQVRAKPNAVAIIDDKGQTTYAQLAAQATRIALLIEASTEERSVGILLPACATFAASFYGALMAGRAVVPINFMLSPQQVAHIVVDSGIDLVLSAPPLAEKFAGLPARVIDLVTAQAEAASGGEGNALPPSLPGATSDADSLAVMLYTSGTSGMPKGVPLSHANLHASVEGAIRLVFRGSNHHFLGLAPLFHSTGFTGTLLAPMRLGAPVTYIARFSPVATLKAIREGGCDIVIAVPSMYGALMNLKSATPDDFAKTFALICGGEPLSGALREAFEERFKKPLLQGYGLSETCGPIAVNAPHAHRHNSVGQLIPAGKVRIAAEDGTPLSPGETGEIQLGGPSIMHGYHNLPDATAEAMTSDGFFRTGDLGHVDADGFLFITGRAKDMIIISGEKLAPREIEELLGRHPAIAEAAVVPRKDESRGEVPVAFVVPREGHTIDAATARDHLKTFDLPNWKLPKDVIVVDALPRSPTGKVLKRELVARL